AVEQAVIADEFARRDLPLPSTVIGEWVLPTLLEHGTDAQRRRFVEPTLRGEIVWCQLFSEPGAGSDLAGLSTKARRVDGGWSLNRGRAGGWPPPRSPASGSAWARPVRATAAATGSGNCSPAGPTATRRCGCWAVPPPASRRCRR